MSDSTEPWKAIADHLSDGVLLGLAHTFEAPQNITLLIRRIKGCLHIEKENTE